MIGKPSIAAIGYVSILAAVLGLAAETVTGTEPPTSRNWSVAAIGSSETALLRSLWLGSLPAPPAATSNAVADDPRAAKLGQRLFFDTRLSADGQTACAGCHQPERNFTDGLPRARGIDTGNRKTMTIVGSAYSPWLFWDGRKDSLWSQALGPLENPAEHGWTRLEFIRLIADDSTYRRAYRALFGPLPDLSDRDRFPGRAAPVDKTEARAAWEAMTVPDRKTANRVFANLGKAFAAYQRLILPGPGRFDRYVQALLQGDEAAMERALTPPEVAGMKLFIGKAQCVRCHNGPLFTNNEFHNTGVPLATGLPPDHGRRDGIPQAKADPFNCLGPYGNGAAGDCAELRFAKTGEQLDGTFKTPGLRNVAKHGPYMHAGQFAGLKQVLAHYNTAPPAPVGQTELQPLRLSESEVQQLEAFLGSLSGPLATDPKWLQPLE